MFDVGGPGRGPDPPPAVGSSEAGLSHDRNWTPPAEGFRNVRNRTFTNGYQHSFTTGKSLESGLSLTMDVELGSPYGTTHGAPLIDEDADAAYVTTDAGWLARLNLSDGTVTWKNDIGGSNDNGPRSAGHLTADGNWWYVGTLDGRMLEVDTSDGTTTNLTGATYSNKIQGPHIDEDAEIAYFTLLGSYTCVAWDLTNGVEKWSFVCDSPTTGNAITYATPEITSDTVYICDDEGYGGSSGKIYALNKTDGTLNWKVAPEAQGWSTGNNHRMRGSPVYDPDRGQIYWSGNTEHVHATDLSGNLLWESPNLGGVVEPGAAFTGDAIYASGYDSTALHCLDPDDGTVIWKNNGADWTGSNAYPVVCNEIVTYASFGTITVFDRYDGSIVAEYKLPYDWNYAAATTGGKGRVMASSDVGRFFMFE